MTRRPLGILLTLALVAPAILLRSAEVFPGAPPEVEVQQLLDKTTKAFVFIGGGSGVVISPDGRMLTNHHVIRNAKSMQVRTGEGKSYTAKVVGKDPIGDLALLKIQGAKDLPHLPLADSDALRLGEFCIAIGNPFGAGTVDQSPAISLGVISGLHVYHGRYADAIVTDAPINPGNSGGPLINRRGEVVGINGMIQPRWGLKSNTGLGYAIPANQIKLWLPHFEKAKGGVAYHARLTGIDFDSEGDNAELEARIRQVREGSDAQKAGFQEGDVVRTFDGKPVPTAVRFRSLVGIYPAKTKVKVTVLRDQAEKTLEFPLAAMRTGNLGFTLAKLGKDDKHLKVGKVGKDLAKDGEGLKTGDRIIAVNGRRMAGPVMRLHAMMSFLLRSIQAGQKVSFKVLRGEGEDETEHTVTLVAE